MNMNRMVTSGRHVFELLVRRTVAAVLFLAVPLWAMGSDSALREGVKAYQQGNYQKALVYFQQAVQADSANGLAYFNLGDALYRLGKYQEAASAFERALVQEDTQRVQAAYYNLGNAYFQLQDYQKAATFYRKALALNPRDADAKHNLELTLRKLKQQPPKQEDQKQQKNQNQPNIQPSEFAKRLKQLADQLVAQNRYQEAFHLMQEGLRKDKTVAAYQDFIKRLGDVVEVVQKSEAAI